MLTREQIESAKQDVSHPVVQLLLNEQDWIARFRSLWAEAESDKQKFIHQEIGNGLALRLNELDDFSMAPLDIVSIWAQVCKDFPSVYMRYDLSSTISATYATRGIASPDWKGVVQSIARENELPETLLRDRKNQLYFWRRIREIGTNLDELSFYSYGTRENFADLSKKAYKEGDKEAEKRFEKLSAWYDEHKDTILSQIHENFGNGLSTLKHSNVPRYIIRKVLRK